MHQQNLDTRTISKTLVYWKKKQWQKHSEIFFIFKNIYFYIDHIQRSKALKSQLLNKNYILQKLIIHDNRGNGGANLFVLFQQFPTRRSRGDLNLDQWDDRTLSARIGRRSLIINFTLNDSHVKCAVERTPFPSHSILIHGIDCGQVSKRFSRMIENELSRTFSPQLFVVRFARGVTEPSSNFFVTEYFVEYYTQLFSSTQELKNLWRHCRDS